MMTTPLPRNQADRNFIQRRPTNTSQNAFLKHILVGKSDKISKFHFSIGYVVLDFHLILISLTGLVRTYILLCLYKLVHKIEKLKLVQIYNGNNNVGLSTNRNCGFA